MAFPLGILCIFIGACLVWVGAHGTNATGPYDLFQQVISGLSGQGSGESDSSDTGPNTNDSVGNNPGQHAGSPSGPTIVAN